MARDWTQDEVIKDLERVIEKQDKEIERLREAAKDRPKDRPNEAANEIEKLKGALLEIKSIPKQKRGSASYAMAAIAEAALKEGE